VNNYSFSFALLEIASYLVMTRGDYLQAEDHKTSGSCKTKRGGFYEPASVKNFCHCER
jgi:hypothetical protein